VQVLCVEGVWLSASLTCVVLSLAGALGTGRRPWLVHSGRYTERRPGPI